MLYTHKISFDLSKQEPRKRLPAVYGTKETVAVEISLYDGAQQWQIPDGSSCVIRFMKANGNGGVYHVLADDTSAWHIQDNRITFTLIPESMDYPGLVDISLVLENGGRTLGIYGFDIHVDSNLFQQKEEAGNLLEVTDLIGINTALTVLQNQTKTDPTLSVSGKPADSAAVGEAVSSLSSGKAPVGHVNFTGAVSSYGELITLIQNTFAAIPDNSEYRMFVNFSVSEGAVPAGSWFICIHREWENYGIVELINDSYHLFIRKYAQWKEPEWENPPMVPGVEYHTTQRWQGKVVFAKLIDFGVLPAGTAKEIYPALGATAVVEWRGTMSDGTALPYADINVAVSTGMIRVTTAFDASAYSAQLAVWYVKE